MVVIVLRDVGSEITVYRDMFKIMYNQFSTPNYIAASSVKKIILEVNVNISNNAYILIKKYNCQLERKYLK